MRVQKALSAAGLMSRRKAEDAIRAGRIAIDGRIAQLGDRVDPEAAIVELDGRRIPVAPDRVTFVLNKPIGVISTTDDTHDRPTVTDLVPTETRIWPVGRLDVESEGLLLLTNDGDLTNWVTHPRYGITKTYLVMLDGDVPSGDVRAFAEGVQLEDGPAAAVSSRVIDRRPGRTLIELVMGEGRNREIRRMAAALGLDVTRLVRTAIGPLVDRRLGPGEHRRLAPDEVSALYRAADHDPGPSPGSYPNRSRGRR